MKLPVVLLHQMDMSAAVFSYFWLLCRPVAKGGRAALLNPSAPLSSPPPLEQEIVQWPCPLIDRLSGLLRKTELSIGCSVGFKYAKNALADPTGGAHDAPPDLLVSWGGGHQSQCPTFSTSILVPSLLPPWKPGAPADLATVLLLCTVVYCRLTDRKSIQSVKNLTELSHNIRSWGARTSSLSSSWKDDWLRWVRFVHWKIC